MKDREHILLPLIVASLAFACLLVWWQGDLGQTDDDARMILEARGLWQSGELPSTTPSHAGMLLVLAPLSHSLVLMHLFVWACYFGLVAVVYRWAGPWASVCTALSPWILYWSAEVMTEIPFALFSIAGLWQAEKRRWVAALLLAFVACTFRSIGVTLVGAICLSWIWEHRKAPFIGWLGLLPACVAIAWMRRTHGSIPGMSRGPYDRTAFTFADLPDRIWTNLQLYLTWQGTPPEGNPPHLLHGFLMADAFRKWWPVWLVVASVLLALSIYGLHRRRNLTVWLYLGLYGTALLCWPVALSGSRYVVPVVPILLVGLSMVQRPAFKWARYPAVLYIAICLYALNVRYQNGPHIPLGVREYRYVATLLRRSPPNSVIVCRKTNVMTLMSGRQTKLYPYNEEPEEVMAWVESLGSPTFLVLDQLGYPQTKKYLAPVWDLYPERFIEVGNSQRDDPTTLLRLRGSR